MSGSTSPPRQDPDPLAWRLEMRNALADPALDVCTGPNASSDSQARRAAYRLAVALGKCRLFGVELGEEDGSLPAPVAMAAALECTEHLKRWVAAARSLSDQWEKTHDETEADELCFHLLETRMECWAVFLALDEAYQASVERRLPERIWLAQPLGLIQEGTDFFDIELHKNLDLLSTVAHANLLPNWRRLLAAPYRLAIPWWLDGTLENAAASVLEESLAWQPRQLKSHAQAWETQLPAWREMAGVAGRRKSMEFHPYEPFDDNKAQRYVWESLKTSFRDDAGVAYYRYHIFPRNRRRRREPDVLLLHPTLGLGVLECKACRIDNILAINGSTWTMRDWHEEFEAPLEQAADQMFAVKGRYEERRDTSGLLSFHYAVALPFVTRAEWQARGYDRHTGSAVLLKEDLMPGSIRTALEHLAAEHPQRPLTPEKWVAALSVLRGNLPSPDPHSVPTDTPASSLLRVIRSIEGGLKVLDNDQNAAAFEIPNGPQRIRGLAGTGKTVLLAQRAAKMHARHPEWSIVFAFFTKSLYDDIRERIAEAYRNMTGEEPNWHRLQVLHAWKFYKSIAGHRYLTAAAAKKHGGTRSPNRAFAYACGQLDQPEIPIEASYDAILIDEGQDMPPAFFRLAYKALREPKRLYWAYDEAQGIGSLLIPSATVVFPKEQGYAVGDLSGNYEGGILKTHVFRRCYRTPRAILMAANAINMGLFRRGGPLQGITWARHWGTLGYEVRGDFRKVGSPVEIRRRKEDQCHPVDLDPSLGKAAGQLITLKPFSDDAQEAEWVAGQVAADLREMKLQPTDIVVTAMVGDHEEDYFRQLRDAFSRHGVPTFQPGNEDEEFWRPGHVTIANIHRAKGNEAWKVYACRFHYATQPLAFKEGETEVHKRNEAFVALTRTRVSCVVTGRESPVFEELRTACEQLFGEDPALRFKAFTQSTLARVLEESDDVSAED